MNSDWEDSQANETGQLQQTQEWYYFRWFDSKLINLFLLWPSVHAKLDSKIILDLTLRPLLVQALFVVLGLLSSPFYWDVCLALHALSPKPAFKYPNNKICQAGYLRAIWLSLRSGTLYYYFNSKVVIINSSLHDYRLQGRNKVPLINDLNDIIWSIIIICVGKAVKANLSELNGNP